MATTQQALFTDHTGRPLYPCVLKQETCGPAPCFHADEDGFCQRRWHNGRPPQMGGDGYCHGFMRIPKEEPQAEGQGVIN